MTREQLAGTALAAFGLLAFGLALRTRARRLSGRSLTGGPGHRFRLEAAKAHLSPEGERVAVVIAGPPFEDRVDSAIEMGLWWLFWLLPVRLCRIEVWIYEVPAPWRGAPIGIEDLLERPPAAKRLIWRGQGHPREAGEVEVSWICPDAVVAKYRGTAHRIEAREVDRAGKSRP